MDHKYFLNLLRLSGKTFELNRINIFLGINGSGKSKVLQEIKANLEAFGQKSVIFVEGGRTININDSLGLDGSNIDNFKSVGQAKENHKRKHSNTLSSRIREALLLIDMMGTEVQLEHSKAVTDWQANGQSGNCPLCEELPLLRLFALFEEIFPSIKLQFDSSVKRMTCVKNGSQYAPSQLSDGEKQIFSLLADIVILGGDQRLVIVDEPELNLNPGLANRFWDLVENELPNSVFIYGTHSVSFAMRENVERIFVLSNQDENIAEIKNVKEIDAVNLAGLLGSIPALLSSSHALVVEGKENSIDTICYRWLLNKKDTEIVAAGGCEDVKAIVNKTGVWDVMAPSVKLLGIIDRDFKPQSLIDIFKDSKCFILDYHEIESYLCQPMVVVQVADGIGSMAHIPSEVEVIALIKSEFEKDMIQIIARRVFARANIRLGVSIENNLVKNIKDTDDLEQKLVDASNSELSKATTELGPDAIKKIVKEETSRCKKALEDGAVDEILAIIPGKGLLNKLAPMAGCRNDAAFARAATKHVTVDLIPNLVSLQTALNKIRAV